MRQLIDITGQKFAKLTVIERAGSDKWGCALWKCQCECGNLTIVRGSKLRRGETKSCGHCNFQDLTGQQFGKLLVLELDKTRMNSRKEGNFHSYWKCICECGNTTTVRDSELKNGHTISCGCIRSKGELIISKILQNENIVYEKEKKFDGLIGKTLPLRFDFAIYDKNELLYLIEYQGIQHFIPIELFGGEEKLKEYQQYDALKEQYCKVNKIPLVKITYLDKEINYDLIKERLYEAQEVYGHSSCRS